jgi:hypothetical protein
VWSKIDSQEDIEIFELEPDLIEDRARLKRSVSPDN